MFILIFVNTFVYRNTNTNVYRNINVYRNTNINVNLNNMKVSHLILEKILNDSTFSGELAIELGITQQSVKSLAKRNSEKLTLYAAILFYRSKGFKDEEIFEDLKSKEN